ncbi:MAG: thioredoxin family protein [Pseudomonadota bacterium]
MKSASLPLRALLATLLFGIASALFAADLPAKFDPNRDAAKDVAAATAQAKAQGKRVMVDVGGEWCSWCHILDKFIDDNADVKSLVESKFVWVKVNWSLQNKNEALLAKWPKIKGYPHLIVLDANGKMLQSQNTGELEAEKSYDKAKMMAFLREAAAK